MYDRRIAGKDLTFGVSGKLHANSLIMYDHQTESLWSHLAGAAVAGALKGEKLKPLPSMFTRWDTWKKLHPKTKVLSTGRGLFSSSLRDPYESYYRSSDKGIVPTRRSDNRIYPKEFIQGLVLNEKAKAYPFSALSRQHIVNDTFEGTPLVVVFDPESTTAATFHRKIGGRTPFFNKAPASKKKGIFLVDDATGSIWEGLSGKAVEGKLKGNKLPSIPSTPSFWFGWVDHYPDTELYLSGK